MSKTLLITTLPLHVKTVGGIILSDLYKKFDPKAIDIIVLPHYKMNARQYNETLFICPEDNFFRPLPGKWGGIIGDIHHRLNYASKMKSVSKEVSKICTRNSYDKIWVTLDSISVIYLIDHILKSIKTPIHSLVWDHPEYFIRKKGYASITQKRIMLKFENIIRSSKKIAGVSQQMIDFYESQYGTPGSLLRHAIKPEHNNASINANKITIGFCGTLYSSKEFEAFISALSDLEWTINGSAVEVIVCGGTLDVNYSSPVNVRMMGRLTPQKTVEVLSTCHFNYLPIASSNEWREFAMYSFPTKLSTYLAAGRPVLVHGPKYSSSYQFCERTHIGLSSDSLEPTEVAKEIEQILNSNNAPHFAKTAKDVCLSEFSVSTMEAQLKEFLS